MLGLYEIQVRNVGRAKLHHTCSFCKILLLNLSGIALAVKLVLGSNVLVQGLTRRQTDQLPLTDCHQAPCPDDRFGGVGQVEGTAEMGAEPPGRSWPKGTGGFLLILHLEGLLFRTEGRNYPVGRAWSRLVTSIPLRSMPLAERDDYPLYVVGKAGRASVASRR